MAKSCPTWCCHRQQKHAPYGGVVPEIAARSHLVHLDRLVKEAMTEARVGFDGLDAIAVTAGPGLIGGVLTGLMTAKAIAMAAGKPLYAVNHLEGHALTPGLTEGLRPPYLMLLVSGGHTQLVSVEGLAGMSGLVRPLMMHSVRPLTRPRSYWGWAIRAGRKSKRRPARAILRGMTFPCR
jgi:tRNA A37 threonylcarbamoyltransferase TsaD